MPTGGKINLAGPGLNFGKSHLPEAAEETVKNGAVVVNGGKEFLR